MSHVLSVYKKDHTPLITGDLEKLKSDFDIKNFMLIPGTENISDFSVLYKNDNGEANQWFENGVEIFYQEDEKNSYSAIIRYGVEEDIYGYYMAVMNTIAFNLNLILHTQMDNSQEEGEYYSSGYDVL